ncbi:MAG: 16S rRNA (cytosine(1402)-N(4))-methyltransferase RsmH [Anaplasmataceae bacterium]|nr:16S rRNA (cytosine(1402)-N(4))-methyltransferase RsmH [Anaplasmataceae bacterium]
MHLPVLLNEVIEELNLAPGKIIVDGTVDGGGHAGEIVKRLKPHGVFIGVDWDKGMVKELQSTIKVTGVKTSFIHGNYADLSSILEKEKIGRIDGLLLDLGFSSEQLENSGRGFSFLKDEPLLMTYDDSRAPAWKVLRELKEDKLADIIFEFGGERLSRRIAKAIKTEERKKPIKTSGQLAVVVKEALPQSYERGRIHPATRTFQALRIYINQELDNLQTVLENLPRVMSPSGRVVVISFHSLEDKIVKDAFRRLVEEKQVKLLHKKPIVASAKEIAQNPRSRSAKLRTIEFL